MMEIYTASKARENLYHLVDSVSESHEPAYIVGKRNTAVMLSIEDYESMMETIYIHAVPGLKESILAARNTPIEHYSDKLDWDE